MGEKGDESKSEVIVRSTRSIDVNNVNNISLNREMMTQFDIWNCFYTNADIVFRIKLMNLDGGLKW